jgi:hypothetical protein
MSRYIMIRRLRGPSILLLIGVLALLHQTGVLPRFWHLFWPLLLILIGLLMLAERAALASEGYPMFSGWPWQSPGPGAPNSGEGWRGGWHETSRTMEQSGAQSTETAIVPSQPHDLENRSDGGQS